MTSRDTGLSAWRFAVVLAAIMLLAVTLRMAFPLADPPWFSPVGVVWHDEGAWVHNARNRALTGAWQVDGDRWNPIYVTPVLTGLEYASFRAFGVGLWQARLVSEIMGSLAVLLLGLGVARIGGRTAGLIAAGLLATNFVSVMYDRAATMEATMVSFLVASWFAYGKASESPRWGLVAGAAAMLAYFTKASAVFFLAAIGLDAAIAVVRSRGWLGTRSGPREEAAAPAWYTLGGLVAAGVLSLAFFVGPNWQEYRFYNWQMSVTRKPTYSVKAILDRLSWFPVIHDFFTRMWTATALAVSGGLGLISRWTSAAPAERLLALWLVIGSTELVLHDVGNERRLVFLIPALVAMAALTLARDRSVMDERVAGTRLPRALLAAPAVVGGLYLVGGAAIRLPFLDEIHASVFRSAVRWSAAAAVAMAALIYASWPRVPRLLSRIRWTVAVGVVAAVALAAADLWQYSEWAAIRTFKNYDAMVAIGRWLPPGTLVHGKLANGLALESGITPVFVGRGFGNYEDRARRPDVRYLLTYSWPRRPGEQFGYESQRGLIGEILAACPGWKVLHEFDVAETAGGRDRAVLIDKYPDRK
jgi:4-amino-4-deoxy-L-arabinose transferase-like glycosyltransferase